MTLGEIERIVAARFGVAPGAIKSLNRERKVARPRQVAMALARELARLSLPRIGTYFCRDHTTILHACRRVAKLSAADPDFARAVEGCRLLLKRADCFPPSVRHAGKPATAHLPPSAASRSTGKSSTGASASGLTGRKLEDGS